MRVESPFGKPSTNREPRSANLLNANAKYVATASAYASGTGAACVERCRVIGEAGRARVASTFSRASPYQIGKCRQRHQLARGEQRGECCIAIEEQSKSFVACVVASSSSRLAMSRLGLRC